MSNLSASALPLDDQQSSRLQQAVAGLSPDQLQWVSGYAAGSRGRQVRCRRTLRP